MSKLNVRNLINNSEFMRKAIDIYDVGIYRTEISLTPSGEGHLYETSILNENLRVWIAETANKLRMNFPLDFEKNILKLQDVLREFQDLIREIQIPLVDGVSFEDWSLAIAFETIGLGKLAPLLLDPNIEEIYLDSEQSPLYLDHAKYGRCKTLTQLSDLELSTFLSRVALDNQFALNRTNPSMKADLVTDQFHIRVSADISPLAVDGTHLSIRKLRQGTFTMPRLCANGTLSELAAAFLVWTYFQFANVTIVGSPGSGKTTLQNALLGLTAPHLRVISVEDTVESNASQHLGHLIRFKVDPFEKDVKRSSKTAEIIKLLHRSPDVLNLGEITTDEHALSWFHAMSAGIPSIQTIHGSSLEYLLMRLTEIFKIPAVLLQTSVPHVLIEMKAFWHQTYRKRQVTRIAEIVPHNGVKQSENLIQIQDIFIYNPQTDQLELQRDLSTLESFKEITKFKPVSIKSFYDLLEKLMLVMKTKTEETIESLNTLLNTHKFEYSS
ncbi:MAG: ATPase, T2SS/T4P/T4SS family [Candidatus Hermodarchaeota archaeon]